MAMLSEKPAVRKGTCSLVLVIEGRRYRITPGEPICRGAKIWRLQGMPRTAAAGAIYSVCSFHSHVDCTCPDSTVNFAVCKHIRALQALGMVAKSATPSIMIAWRNIQPRAPPSHRSPPVAESPAPVSAKTRRLHKPTLPADDAAGFAAGWNDAVRRHLATRAAKGGVL